MNLEKGGSSRQTETVMTVLQEKELLPAELRIPRNSTVNKYGLALDQLTIKHGLEFITNAVELRLGVDASTTRNKHVLAAGLKNEKNEFFGCGFIETPGHDAESMFQGYISILKRYDFEGVVPILIIYKSYNMTQFNVITSMITVKLKSRITFLHRVQSGYFFKSLIEIYPLTRWRRCALFQFYKNDQKLLK